MPRTKKKVSLNDLSLSDLNNLHMLMTDCITMYNRVLGNSAYLDPNAAKSMIEPVQRDILEKRNRYEVFHVKVRKEIEKRIDEFIKNGQD